MDIAGYRRVFRMLFFVGAMVVCFGLGLFLMGMDAVGILLIALGGAALVITFSMTRFFLLYDMSNSVRRK